MTLVHLTVTDEERQEWQLEVILDNIPTVSVHKV